MMTKKKDTHYFLINYKLPPPHQEVEKKMTMLLKVHLRLFAQQVMAVVLQKAQSVPLREVRLKGIQAWQTRGCHPSRLSNDARLWGRSSTYIPTKVCQE
jgi:hypothetical protein